VTTTLECREPSLDLDEPHIDIRAADDGGWDVCLVVEGHALPAGHCSDWHRAERLCARLEARHALPHRAARVLRALLLVLAVLPAQAFAQSEGAAAPALFPDPRVLHEAVTFVAERKAGNGAPENGVYASTGNMITGAGWISGGPGYRHRLLGERAIVDVSGALSWRLYKTAQARFELPALAGDHVSIGAQALWRDMTQVRDADSDYRLRTTNVVGYATVRPEGSAVSMIATAGWLDGPRISSSTGPFDRDLPDTAAGGVPQPSFVHGDLSLVHDTRNHPGHPTAGGLYRGTWVGFRARDGGPYVFTRYETEGAHFIPLAGGRLVVAAHGLGVFSSTARGRSIPFYLLPALGGHNTLRGYSDYRFHDRHLLVANLESRFPLMAHVDGALFVDAGNVAPRVKALDLARTSYGAGVRLHTGASTIARLDLARGDEGWQVLFRLSDPLRLARLSRRTAAAPFVP